MRIEKPRIGCSAGEPQTFQSGSSRDGCWAKACLTKHITDTQLSQPALSMGENPGLGLKLKSCLFKVACAVTGLGPVQHAQGMVLEGGPDGRRLCSAPEMQYAVPSVWEGGSGGTRRRAGTSGGVLAPAVHIRVPERDPHKVPTTATLCVCIVPVATTRQDGRHPVTDPPHLGVGRDFLVGHPRTRPFVDDCTCGCARAAATPTADR